MLRFVILVLGALAQQTFADEPEAIVGGTIALPGEFPYQCSVNLYDKHFCGCSIIDKNHVLTAAHCVQRVARPPSRYLNIVMGTVISEEGKMHPVKNVQMHPDYAPDMKNSMKNDIAVITLQEPITFDKYQSAVDLPTAPPVIGSKCVLSGWGKTTARGSNSPKLLKMNTVLVDRKTCSSKLRHPLYETHVCAFTEYGIGACQGDSGGPLVCNGKQVGIVSFVSPCALGIPDVYTDVYHHRDYIRQAIAD